MSAASGDKNMIARTKIALPFALDAEARRSGEGRPLRVIAAKTAALSDDTRHRAAPAVLSETLH